MHIALPVLALVAAVLVVSALARRIGLSAPLLLTGLGALASFVPGMPTVEVEPELILVGILPPLLFAAASQTSLVDLRRERYAVLALSVGLVVFTAFGVALVVGPLLSLSFAAALALGAVVAPPDAVAATAVARRIGLPRRIVSILEGESLFNDATALVLLSTALVATSETVTPLEIGWDFLVASVGGVLVGVVVFWVIAVVRRRITDTTTSVVLSFMSPWMAYLPAEAVHASGVIATVVCGLLLAHKAPYLQTAQSRVAVRLNWDSIQFVLENLVFLLIGLETATIVDHVVEGPLGFGRVLLISIAVLLTVMALRMLWMLVGARLGAWRSVSGSLSTRESVVAGWAGMRGVVTLAAAFTITRDEVPERESLIFIALVVTIGTLIVQGFTLGRVARAMDLHAPDPREDALQQAQLLQAAVSAGEHRLDEEIASEEEPVPEAIAQSLRAGGRWRANLAWERLGRGSTEGAESPNAAYRRLRLQMIAAERAKVLKYRSKGVMDHEVLRPVMDSIDVEESMLAAVDTQDAELRQQLLLTPESRRGGCEDLAEAPTTVDPSTHDDVCVDCLREGTDPVQLRLCLTCGYVGCCDSSIPQHSTRHYERTGHPVMRTFEPGEAWRWCYRHQLLG